jgi:hypothetical protein
LEWRTKAELFEQVRREFEFGVGTISGVAKKLNIHRRMGAGGDWQRLATAAEESEAAELEAGSGNRVRRSDFGDGLKGPAEAATHGPSDLGGEKRW